MQCDKIETRKFFMEGEIMSFYDGKIPAGCVEMRKEEIFNVISTEHEVGKIFNIYNHKYGEITVIPTRTAGNLVLQHGYYPVACVQSETRIAALNAYKYKPDSQFTWVQNFIREKFKTIELDNVDDMLRFVENHKNTDWSK